MVPELAIAMLACARIGAPHSVIFGGFSAETLRDRTNDCQSTLVVTADGGYRRGSVVALKKIADEGPAGTRSSSRRSSSSSACPPRTPRCRKAGTCGGTTSVKDQPGDCDAEVMDSEDMLFLLYTSGSTGKPKGILHTTGGYMTGVYATTKWIFDSRKRTSTGAPPTSAGSPATRTSSTARCSTARPC
jgi:acetyl-CoA synthetase